MAGTTSDQLGQPPMRVIETSRLRLRTLQMSDVDALLPILTNPTTMLRATGHVNNRLQAEQWLSARALGQGVFNFLITLKHDDSTVGVLGSYHWPSVGYIVHADHAGNGYATEALLSFIPSFFAHMPSAELGGLGYDFIEAHTDLENFASQRVLEKCGFRLCEVHVHGTENPMLGVRDTKVFRVARSGKTLEELGLAVGGEGGEREGFVPPVR